MGSELYRLLCRRRRLRVQFLPRHLTERAAALPHKAAAPTVRSISTGTPRNFAVISFLSFATQSIRERRIATLRGATTRSRRHRPLGASPSGDRDHDRLNSVSVRVGKIVSTNDWRPN